MNKGYPKCNIKCNDITDVKDMNKMCVKSALSTVNTLMKEKSIIETVEQI